MELFYDLIFVAAIIQLGDTLSTQVTQQHAVAAPFAWFFALFAPLWVAWTGYTFFANRFTLDDASQRLLVFLKMFAVGVMAIAAPGVAAQESHTTFALAYAVAQTFIVIMYVRAWRQVEDARPYARYWGSVFAIGAVLWLISAFVPAPWAYALWAGGVGAVLFAPINKKSRELAQRFPLDMEHLSERYGLLTIIVLGESFVKVLSYLTGEGMGDQVNYLFKAGLSLFITCSVWWIYFDDVAGSEVQEESGGWIAWLYGHLPLAVGITGLGVAVKKTITFNLDQPPDSAYRWLLVAALALVFFSVGIIDSVTEREHAELSSKARVNARFFSMGVLVLIAAVGGTMSSGLFLAIITAVCLGQIIFDLMMAPLEEDDDLEHAVLTSELAKRARDGTLSSDRKKTRERRELGSAVRKGAPSELKRDLYFFFMEGSWTRLFFALGFLWVMVNAIFAGLFLLEPGSITGVDSPTFLDAFAFSVQTMSTIGYGVMSPATEYGDLVVALEAAVGILGVALATGIMFAKASRPRPSVLFSEPVVITEWEGTPTMMFRAGNARGNEVVEAEVKVSVLRDHISDEGHHMRRMHDLELVRNRSPFFTLSWQIMHKITEDSPLYGVDFESPDCAIQFIAVTMSAHDVTYAQETYARHIYMPFDVRESHRFVDVISETQSGQMVVDFTKFHDTKEE
jgi:inward rectifier potassium channel